MAFDESAYPLNYVTANRFYVEMEAQITACFNKCSGPGVTIGNDKLKEGGVNEQQRIMLKQADFSDITLEHGVTDNLTFWNWINAILAPRNGNTTAYIRRNVNILTFNQAGETMQCWTLIGAIPVGWKAPSLDASSTQMGIETLTLAYEGLKIVSKPSSSGSGAALLESGRGAGGYFTSG